MLVDRSHVFLEKLSDERLRQPDCLTLEPALDARAAVFRLLEEEFAAGRGCRWNRAVHILLGGILLRPVVIVAQAYDATLVSEVIQNRQLKTMRSKRGKIEIGSGSFPTGASEGMTSQLRSTPTLAKAPGTGRGGLRCSGGL